jgi:NADH-quinone oxidoreductase subunit N
VSNPSPVIAWAPLVPVLIVLGAAMAGVLIEAFIRTPSVRRLVQTILAFAATGAAMVVAILQWAVLEGDGLRIAGRYLVSDRQSLAWQVILALFGLLGMLLFSSRTQGEDAFTPLASAAPGSSEEALATKRGFVQTEVFPLGLFAIGGMMLFSMVSDTIVLFVVLEILSLPLYLLVGLARRRRLMSHEAALKYFLMGAFASAIYLFGASLLYGYSSSTAYAGIADAIASGVDREPLLLAGVVLMLVGLIFKLGAVPFHGWTPDVYQGAPTPVTAFMAAATKAAAAAALARLLYLALDGIAWEIAPVLWTVAIATMLLGTVVAIVQTDVKRMLAYSSIAHAGFLLVALTSFRGDALAAVPFYMLAYGLATLGAFAVVSQVREHAPEGGLGSEATRLGQWAGLGRRSPWLAAAMGLFLLSFAGIPLTAGFIGKFVAFKAAIDAGAWPLVLIAVLASAAAAFIYVRLIVLMFLTPVPADLEDTVEVTTATGPSIVVLIAAVGTVLLGIFPSPVLDLAHQAAILVP